MNHPTNSMLCLNCRSKVDSNFCSNCGQSTSVDRITFQETIGDFFSSTFALEGSLTSTIKHLIINPGELLRAFIAGKRKAYYKPVAFFVVLTAFYLIVRSVIQHDPFQNIPSTGDASEKTGIFLKAGKFMFAHINHIMFLLAFSIGISSKLFFYKKYNLAEYYTVGFYVSGIYILIGIIQMVMIDYFDLTPSPLQFGLLLLYMIYVFYSFHQKRNFWSIVKYVFSGITAIILYVILGLGLSLVIVFFS